MKQIFEESYQKYKEYLSGILPDFWEFHGYETRRLQCESFINSLNTRFNFDPIITIETGVSQNPKDAIFGVFLGFATEKTNGIMVGVDINDQFLNTSKELYSLITPKLRYDVVNSDSVHFLKETNIVPNIVHLDSWDLNLLDPLPGALHGWNEFIAIESRMPSGSIIIIDDNYIRGTWVDWHYGDGTKERIDITYPIIGKGANVYQYVLSGKSDWVIIGDHYNIHNNIKVIIQKK